MKKMLITIPSVAIWTDGEDLVFDRKFYDGTLTYVDNWDGRLHCIMRSSNDPLPSFGVVRKKYSDLPFDLTVLTEQEKIKAVHLRDASIVLAAGDSFDQFHISALCKRQNIKCVYVIEYIPETRYQIVDLEAINRIVKLRRLFFIWNGERKRMAAFRDADGLQANGTAAYNAYKKFKNCMIYFDSRVTKNLIIRDRDLDDRLRRLKSNRPLNLAFSGRLVKMKGADHLVPLARLLKDRYVKFNMTIYGAGDQENSIAEKIEKLRLTDKVKLAGAVDFSKELMPQIRKNIDLFIILHRQSDPSCTYLETMACGTPIVGYENRAFKGLLEKADIGWGREIDDLNGIAGLIKNLDRNRASISEKSINCVKFARAHDFEHTFSKRIDHLQKLLD